MNLKLKRTPGIYLVGFMGSGKSTIGRLLAHRLGWNFFDTDEEIEAAERTTIAEIFEGRGEPEFRRIETEILRQHVSWIERGRPSVVARARPVRPWRPPRSEFWAGASPRDGST
jgi:shikimate kinase